MKAEVWEALNSLKKNNEHINLVQKTLEAQEKQTEELQEQVLELEGDVSSLNAIISNKEEEVDELNDKLTEGLTADNLQEELANALLLRFKKNLTLQQLEELERSAKELYFEKDPLSYRD